MCTYQASTTETSTNIPYLLQTVCTATTQTDFMTIVATKWFTCNMYICVNLNTLCWMFASTYHAVWLFPSTWSRCVDVCTKLITLCGCLHQLIMLYLVFASTLSRCIGVCVSWSQSMGVYINFVTLYGRLNRLEQACNGCLHGLNHGVWVFSTTWSSCMGVCINLITLCDCFHQLNHGVWVFSATWSSCMGVCITFKASVFRRCLRQLQHVFRCYRLADSCSSCVEQYRYDQ